MNRREFLQLSATGGAALFAPWNTDHSQDEPYDLVIQGGLVIDPTQGINARKDLAIKGSKIVAVEERIPTGRARKLFDARGKIVTPGLLDLHVHVYPGVSHYGLEADPVCVARGVTTALDLGSSGYYTFPGFRRYVIEKATTRILSYLSISATGMVSADYNELEEIRNASPRLAAEMAIKNKDIIRGIKIRMSEAMKDLDLVVLRLAQQAAETAGIPVAVHVSNDMRSSLSDVVSRLKPGDMVTHFLHGGRKTILDERGKIRPAIREARERGVYFDVGHGRSSFSFEVAEKALQDGFIPDSISSDVHIYNVNGPVYDQITTLSKFVHLGLTLDQVVERATARPAQVLRRPDLGTLKVGSEADIAILELKEGEFELVDSLRQRRVARRRLFSVGTVRGGKLIAPV